MAELDPRHADAAAFSPSLAAIGRTPPHPLAGWVLGALAAMLGLLLGWASLGRLDIVAVAQGRLVPATRVKIVQPAEAGIVKEILVGEGERVRAGQVLLRMDRVASEADARWTANDFHARRLALRRIDAEIAGLPLAAAADDPPQLLAQARAQREANRRAHEAELAQARSERDKARHELTVAREQRDKLLQTLPLYREQERAFEKLVQDGFAGRLMRQDKTRERIEKERDLGAQEALIRAAGAAIVQTERHAARLAAEYRRRLQAERVDTMGELERLREALAKLEHRHALLDLRAPQDGVVKDLATHTAGAVVAPGTVLLTLVPADDALRAEVWVRNDDVGFVRPGQPVALKLAPYPFQRYGLVGGVVGSVGADAAEPAAGGDGRGADSPAGLAYRTLVDLHATQLDHAGMRLPLAAGMQVAAEIHLGTRSVLEYILSPLRAAFHEAARER